MVSSSAWIGGGLILGILMIWLGLVLVLVSLPLARGKVRAHEYSYRPIQIFKFTNEEKDRLGPASGKAGIVAGVLFILAGFGSFALAVTGNGQYSLMLLNGMTLLMLLGIIVVFYLSIRWVRKVRKEGSRQAR